MRLSVIPQDGVFPVGNGESEVSRMADMMMFPNTVEEFMEQYKIVDTEKIYTNGADLVPIFRMMQWFEHVSATDTISRQMAIDAVCEHGTDLERRGITVLAVANHKQATVDLLENLPSVQPERKTGRWILYDKRFPWMQDYKCSECGNYLDFSGVNAGRGSANFCPNCGADMRGEQE